MMSRYPFSPSLNLVHPERLKGAPEIVGKSLGVRTCTILPIPGDIFDV